MSETGERSNEVYHNSKDTMEMIYIKVKARLNKKKSRIFLLFVAPLNPLQKGGDCAVCNYF